MQCSYVNEREFLYEISTITVEELLKKCTKIRDVKISTRKK